MEVTQTLVILLICSEAGVVFLITVIYFSVILFYVFVASKITGKF